MMSFHRHGALPVTHAVPSIRLSKTTVSPGSAHARVRGVLPPGPVVGRRLAHVGREPDRVVVQADHQAVAQQRGRPPRLLAPSAALPGTAGTRPNSGVRSNGGSVPAGR